jgi:hypothetical protein
MGLAKSLPSDLTSSFFGDLGFDFFNIPHVKKRSKIKIKLKLNAEF